MINRKLAALVAALLVAGAAIWATQLRSQVKPGALFDPDNRVKVTLGKTVYAENCAACHGVKLEGQGDWQSPGPDGLMPAPPHDASGHTWHHADKLLFTITKDGLGKILKDDTYKTNMPVFDGVLSDAEIIAVLSYIKSTWPNNIKARHDQLNAQQAGQ